MPHPDAPEAPPHLFRPSQPRAGGHERWYGFVCQRRQSSPAHEMPWGIAKPDCQIGNATGPSEATVDQADIRALVSGMTAVRRGAASV